jgi:hypothetical protein
MDKWLNLDEFRNGGYLQEANRRFFHPLGLALAVGFEEHVTGIVGVWDYRADPEGMGFAEGVMSPEYAAKIDAEIEAHREVREALFGAIVQPV